MGGEFKIIEKLGLGLVSLTASFVLVLAAWIVFSALLSPPQTLQQNQLSQLLDHRLDLGPGFGSDSSRQPSSVASGALTATDRGRLKSMETLSFDCLDVLEKNQKTQNNKNRKSESKQVRLTGRLCHLPDLNILKSSIVNRTNGTEATLFQLSSGLVSTDFVTLTKGENQFVFELSSASGERYVSDLVISF